MLNLAPCKMAQAQETILDLEHLTVRPAKPSTEEYYYQWRRASYKLNFLSDLRGRALVFVTTINRAGWQKDVKNFYMCCKALNISTEIVYDPDPHEVDHKLQDFVSSDENYHIDCCFVLFMGHGFGKDQNVYYKAKEGFFNIYAKCQFYFRKEISNLKKKPKVVLVQVCRTLVENVELLSRATSDLTEYFRRLPKFTDYKFVFASQHGEFAWRSKINGSFFIRSLCDLLVQNSHDTHLDNVIKMMLFNFENNRESDEVREQMPEEWSSMPRFLNLFPGIKIEPSDLYEVQLPCSRYNQTVHLPRQNIWEEVNISVIKGKQASPPQSARPRLSSCQSHVTSYRQISPTVPKCQNEYELKTEVLVEPDTDENRKDTLRKVLELLSEKQSMLETYLTSELETQVVCKIDKNINVIHMFTEDKDIHEILQFLSDTGLLSSMVQSQLDFKKQYFAADQIVLKIKLNSAPQKKYPTYQHLSDKTVMKDGNITVTLPETKGASNGKWFKNDQEKMNDDKNVRLDVNEEGMHQLRILKAKLSDSGLYSCRYQTMDHREVVTIFSLFVVKNLKGPVQCFKKLRSENPESKVENPKE